MRLIRGLRQYVRGLFCPKPNPLTLILPFLAQTARELRENHLSTHVTRGSCPLSCPWGKDWRREVLSDSLWDSLKEEQ